MGRSCGKGWAPWFLDFFERKIPPRPSAAKRDVNFFSFFFSELAQISRERKRGGKGALYCPFPPRPLNNNSLSL